MTDGQIEILLSGPASQRQTALTALHRAGVPRDALVPEHHGFHDEANCAEGWVAFRAPAPDVDAQHEALAKAATLAKYGWKIRLHRDATRLPVQPAVPVPRSSPLDAMEARLDRMEAELRSLRAGSPRPPIGGGALETPYVISALQSPASTFRQPFASLMSGTGVVNSGDLLVSAQSPTAMAVNVAAGQCWVPGTVSGSTGWGVNTGAQTSVSNSNGGGSTSTGYPADFTSQSNYYTYADAQVALALNSADPTNARIDLAVVTIDDAQYAGSANQAVLQIVTGTAGATPSPPAPPANSLILASIWVPAAATSITSGDINDLRPLAVPGPTSPWQTMTLGTNCSAESGAYTPAWRTQGDVARLRGAIAVSAGGASTLATGLPQPKYGVGPFPVGGGSTGLYVSILNTGALVPSSGTISSTYVSLDALTYAFR